MKHKQRCIALEEQLVELIMVAMERTEVESPAGGNAVGGSSSGSSSSGPLSPSNNDDLTSTHWLWLHLSSQLIYFVLLQFASFPNIVMALHDKVCICVYIYLFLFFARNSHFY